MVVVYWALIERSNSRMVVSVKGKRKEDSNKSYHGPEDCQEHLRNQRNDLCYIPPTVLVYPDDISTWVEFAVSYVPILFPDSKYQSFTFSNTSFLFPDVVSIPYSPQTLHLISN